MPTKMNHGEFKLITNKQIDLPTDVFMNGPWRHLATVTRGLREFVVLLKISTGDIYLEEISATGQFYHIDDSSLWNELCAFCTAKGVTSFVKNGEVIIGAWQK
jgi:hypothetical protein